MRKKIKLPKFISLFSALIPCIFILGFASLVFSQTTYFGNQSAVDTNYAYGTGASTNYVKLSMRFTMPGTGSYSVTQFAVWADSTSAPTSTYNFSIQTDDNTANHYPSGTVVTSSNNSLNPGQATWWYAPLPAANLNGGQIYHFVIDGSTNTSSSKFVSFGGNSIPLTKIFPTVRSP